MATKVEKKQIHFRIDLDKYEKIRKYFKSFGGVGNYFMSAVDDFNNQDRKDRQNLRNEIAKSYKELDREINKMGTNLNQAVHLCNSQAVQGNLTSNFLKETLLPVLEENKQLLQTFIDGIYKLTEIGIK